MTVNITDIKRFAVHDGDGIRTTVFFKGCPLQCVWCHNPEAINAKRQLAFYEHKCVLCGKCCEVCENHKIIDGKHLIDREKCVLCGKCVGVCGWNVLFNNINKEEQDGFIRQAEALR